MAAHVVENNLSANARSRILPTSVSKRIYREIFNPRCRFVKGDVVDYQRSERERVNCEGKSQKSRDAETLAAVSTVIAIKARFMRVSHRMHFRELTFSVQQV